MAKKKAQDLVYGENKRQVAMSLTPTAVRNLDRMGDEMGVSRSEIVEQMARGLIETSLPERKLLGECLAS